MAVSFPPFLVSGQIVENKEIYPGYFLIRANSPELAGRVVPGQFFDVRVTKRFDILLRRPFSIFDYDEKDISMLYEVVGKGTSLLSILKPGEELDILGPLGNGFTIPMEIDRVILVGGGIGVAPLFSWAKELMQMKKRGRKIDVEILIGAKNRYKVLCERDFKRIGLTPLIATDDGSAGYKGFVTELFKERVTSDERRETVVYACGPYPMLRELSAILKKYNLTGEISMERRMGCGMGACLGCVVKTIDGKYKRVCKDGPIFRADEVLWE